MISNQEEDEFVAVRVQDPRMQNEGSWNSYVDYKIFLHTNSKAFTAKTSCVRRRYSEFAWLKKKLQKNAGLVPVPDLPGKSFFSFGNEDFLERRRKGLQAFLDNVVNMTVCLSDSQLHLFLQTQLPVGHIQDCVQGHTPYSVTDAILTYASSNRGFAQAQEDDSVKEPSLTVSYESMESPAPHIPKEIFSPDLLTCADPLDDLLELRDKDTVDFQHKDKSSVRVLQKNNHLEAVVEDRGPADVTFFLGDRPDVPESLGLAEPSQQRSCQIQTPVEVHSPRGIGFEEKCVPDSMFEECSETEASIIILESEDLDLDGEEKADRVESPAEINIENDGEREKCAAVLDFKDRKEQGTESDVGSQEEVLGEVSAEKQVVENEVNGLDASCPEALRSSDDESETPIESEIHEETQSVPEVENDEQMDQQDVDLLRTNSSSSNESIVKVSDEESVCDEAEAANDYTKTPPEVDDSSRNILDLHMNGCSVERDDDLQYISDLSKSLDLNSTVTGGELTEHSDFSIIETPALADSKCTEQDGVSSLSLDASEESQEVEVC